MALDGTAPTAPLYLRLAETLENEVRDLGHSMILPSEEQLAKRFEVSRVTVRRALSVLERGGLIDRRRRRGTMVNPPKVTRTLMPMQPIEEDFRQQGISMHTEVLSTEPEGAIPDRIRNYLQLSDGESISTISLVRSIDNLVICYDRRYIPTAAVARLDLDLVGQMPIAALIARCFDEPVASHKWELEFVPCSQTEARILGILPGTIVVASSGVDLTRGGKPLSANMLKYRVDRVNFAFTSHYSAQGF